MMEIGDKVAALSITRGTVFHSTIFEQIDHGKFFVVIGENDHELVGFFFINSWVNQYIQGKPEMEKAQYPISAEAYNFLAHNSFLNCSSLTTIDKSKLASSISTGETTIKGQLSKEDLSAILDIVRNSKLFTPIEKKTFFAE